MNYDSEQVKAIELCLNKDNRLVGVTGKAGTGKTSLIREIHEKLTEAGYVVALCAPTGKAAKRITEATGIEAKTIHRLLEYPYPGERDPKTGKTLESGVPKRSASFPLACDVVIADEYAMVNTEVHRNLLAAIPSGGSLRVFGDVNQLRPIEKSTKLRNAPSPFRTILERFPAVILETIHRQGEGSGIAQNGELILNGNIPKRFDDFKLHFTTQPVKMLEHIINDAREEGIDFATQEHQIITPTNKGWVGTLALNESLQRLFQPAGVPKMDLPRHTWVKSTLDVSVKDKVIWTENNYDLEIMNGETGIVVEIDDDAGVLHIDFGDRVVEVPPELQYERNGRIVFYDPRVSIDLAYAITTHKSQGSEYKHVIYIINKSTRFIQSRPNLYTGVTRARTMVHLITDQQSLSTSVRSEMSFMDRKES